MPTDFEWDANKARSNVGKHGVRFEDAILVFDDPRHLSRQDRIENGEYRWQTLGLVHGIVVILVAHSIRFEKSGIDVIRIISARKADRKERNRYEHG
ncbi:BrnT family toxin [Citrobacter amalonaticus]|uniref:BrnT family toxin n=1 Tax=Citrobacter amalonaticus TaxID=35703 RepID=UPI0004D3A7DD|nr:BrnT family toxin [Citrobacter amalonaticus]KEY51082.1 membrane protein [Citrobacter amalonaticus]